MANLIEYAESEFRPFSEKPFCNADSLVLSQFVYNNLGAILKDDALEMRDFMRAECFDGLFDRVRDVPSNRRLIAALAASPRFRHLRVQWLTEKLCEKTEEQFAAVTVQLDANTACIVFRGTDASLIGWKEDFNMAFMPNVPSQLDAVSYVNTVGSSFSGGLILSGHSKGGNLSIYAAVACDAAVRARIQAVYSHDGPGFGSNLPKLEAYEEMRPRIQKSIPQSSVIGMLLEDQDTYDVVESRESGFMQHDPFSWVIQDGVLHALNSITPSAQYMDKTLNGWLSGMTNEERARFVDALYEILSAADITNAFEIDFGKCLPAMYKAAVSLDAETRSFVFQAIKNLAEAAVRNMLPPNPLALGGKKESKANDND